MRRLSILAALVAVAGGCGGGSASSPAPASSPQPDAAGIGKERKARELVFFQRQGAAGATLDTISVRVDGTATHDKRYGGAGGRFREYVLDKGALPKLRRALATLPHGGTFSHGTPRPGNANFLIRYAGRTMTGQAGSLDREAKAAVTMLDNFLDGIGVKKVTRVNQTHAQ